MKISYKSITLTPEASAELAKRYPKGFKFSLGGTGLQPALDGPGAARKPDHTGAGSQCIILYDTSEFVFDTDFVFFFYENQVLCIQFLFIKLCVKINLILFY